MPMRVLIAGGVAGGMSAATRLRRLDEFAEVVVYERGPFVSFANCGLPYHVGGEIADRGKLIVQSPARLKAVFGLNIRANTEVTAIDSKANANETLLKKAGVRFQAIHLHPNSHAGYYPGAKPVALKVLFDPGTGKLLGAQAVGADGVDKRIDVLATALHAGMAIDDLAELELAYAPPFGSAKDPINLAGMAAQNVVEGLVEVAQWHEVPALVAAGAVVVDVREPGERDGGVIPGSVSIPLGDLRRRLGELPKDRELLVHCASGQRSYNACRALTQHGFRCRNLTGSFQTWSAGQAG